MTDWITFAQHVREAFARLDDRPYLRSHPLARLLAPTDQPASPEALRRTLLGAIEELRPPEPTLPRSPGWRRYRSIRLRYVDGVEVDCIARELGLGPRQSRRVHQQALDAVAAVLWERHRRSIDQPAGPVGAPPPRLGEGTVETVRRGGSSLEDEVARVAHESAREPTSVREVLEGILRTTAGLAGAQSAAVELAVDEELPLVAVQRVVLRQILLSLLSCALGLARQGKVSIGATSAARAVDLGITVRRRGAGRIRPGSGEMAAVVEAVEAAQRLAEAEGAALTAEALDDDTLCFHLVLPGSQRVNVLVVDDNPDVPRLFQRYLAGTGYALTPVRTGAEALRQLREVRPDVVVLDLLLPSQDGWEILESLKADPSVRSIPVVVCSVLPDKLLALSLGVVDFIPKPVTRQALLAALERCRGPVEPEDGPGSPARGA
ncbi:MAG: response regulator [Chloroflexi bacterium]|nr:response regulator [Chloroflexota bacterium]